MRITTALVFKSIYRDDRFEFSVIDIVYKQM